MKHTKDPIAELRAKGIKAHIEKPCACANLPEPEKNIKALVWWARTAQRWLEETISGSGFEIGEGLERALEPFNKTCGICGMPWAEESGICETCAIEQRAKEK